MILKGNASCHLPSAAYRERYDAMKWDSQKKEERPVALFAGAAPADGSGECTMALQGCSLRRIEERVREIHQRERTGPFTAEEWGKEVAANWQACCEDTENIKNWYGTVYSTVDAPVVLDECEILHFEAVDVCKD